MSIPFTQYLRPDGRKVAVRIDRDPAVEAKAATLLVKGYRFECEVLTTGDCSFTINHPAKLDGADLDIELSSNGTEVPLAVDRLINRYYSRIISCSETEKGKTP